MCESDQNLFSRRTLLQGAGAVSAGVVASGLLAAPAQAGASALPRHKTSNHRTRVVLLGTAGGRTWWGGSQRQGISSAVAVEDAVYLIDFGDGWGRRYFQAGLGGPDPTKGMARLEAAFITHLHTDHVIGYPGLIAGFGPTDGLAARSAPVRVLGPGRRGSLPPVNGNPPVQPPVLFPENPMAGTADMTEHLLRAYASDGNYAMRDGLARDPRDLVHASDIPLPSGLNVDPNTDPAPSMAPFTVFEDSRVRVTATLVAHPPVFPSFAFRFDTDDGSIVFSGDTTVCENLVRLAHRADVLVHEVIDKKWIDGLFPSSPTPPQQAKIEHLLKSHTTIEQVGNIAERAEARTLVLNHFGPADNPSRRWKQAQRGYSGRLIVGDDLMQIGVGHRTLRRTST